MKTERGVYFRRDDCASFWVRVAVDVVDLFAFAVLCTALTAPVMMLLPPSRLWLNVILAICGVIAFFYFVILKRSRFRTLGYRLGRVRIVGIDGRAPSYASLILRLMFGALGPMNWLLDLIWLSNDTYRQAIRDKFASTYVVKAESQPAGEGRVVFRHYSICFYNFLFREVDLEPGVSR